MLQRVMDEIRAAGVITHDQLQRKLGIERSALDDMLALLKRKGYIQDSPCGQSLPDSGCCGTCPGCNPKLSSPIKP